MFKLTTHEWLLVHGDSVCRRNVAEAGSVLPVLQKR